MNFFRHFFGTTSKISMADATTKVQQYIEGSPVGMRRHVIPLKPFSNFHSCLL